MPRRLVALAVAFLALACGPGHDSPRAGETDTLLMSDYDASALEAEGCAFADETRGPAWRCRIAPRSVVRVTPLFGAPDSTMQRALDALVVTWEGRALHARVDTLPFGDFMGRLEPGDVSVADLDGDGWADLRLRHHYGIAANEGHYVWRWMPAARRFAWDALLSEETNVGNDGPGCVSTFGSIGHGGQDQVESRYCLTSGQWVEVARREQRWDDDRGGAFERFYELRGDSLVLVREGEAQE